MAAIIPPEGKESRKAYDVGKCPLCFENYTEPRILDCLHTFCKECIVRREGAEHIPMSTVSV
jgi:hypothetical protein